MNIVQWLVKLRRQTSILWDSGRLEESSIEQSYACPAQLPPEEVNHPVAQSHDNQTIQRQIIAQTLAKKYQLELGLLSAQKPPHPST